MQHDIQELCRVVCVCVALQVLSVSLCLCITFQLLDNIESKMKDTVVEVRRIIS